MRPSSARAWPGRRQALAWLLGGLSDDRATVVIRDLLPSVRGKDAAELVRAATARGAQLLVGELVRLLTDDPASEAAAAATGVCAMNGRGFGGQARVPRVDRSADDAPARARRTAHRRRPRLGDPTCAAGGPGPVPSGRVPARLAAARAVGTSPAEVVIEPDTRRHPGRTAGHPGRDWARTPTRHRAHHRPTDPGPRRRPRVRIDRPFID